MIDLDVSYKNEIEYLNKNISSFTEETTSQLNKFEGQEIIISAGARNRYNGYKAFINEVWFEARSGYRDPIYFFLAIFRKDGTGLIDRYGTTDARRAYSPKEFKFTGNRYGPPSKEKYYRPEQWVKVSS